MIIERRWLGERGHEECWGKAVEETNTDEPGRRITGPPTNRCDRVNPWRGARSEKEMRNRKRLGGGKQKPYRGRGVKEHPSATPLKKKKLDDSS